MSAEESTLRVEPPVDLAIARPSKIIAVGLNYRDHAAESQMDLPDRPLLFAKSFDTFCPVGPALVPASSVPDPQALRIRCLLNGETMQDATTADMIFSVAEVIAFISASIALEPGDVIASGTPPGVGFARTPPVYLAPGDVVTVEIESIGTLTNPVVAAA